jgi:hypothetical protein
VKILSAAQHDHRHAEKQRQEPNIPAKSQGTTGFHAKRGTESGTLPDDTSAIDPNLRDLVLAWQSLPEAIRAGIVAMVKTAQRKK